MKWLINKGQDLLASKAMHASVDLTAKWWIVDARIGTLELFSCDADIAPMRSLDKVGAHFPKVNITNIIPASPSGRSARI